MKKKYMAPTVCPSEVGMLESVFASDDMFYSLGNCTTKGSYIRASSGPSYVTKCMRKSASAWMIDTDTEGVD